jgi:hypothetical protein
MSVDQVNGLAVLTRLPQQINGKPVFSKTTAAYKVGQVKT